MATGARRLGTAAPAVKTGRDFTAFGPGRELAPLGTGCDVAMGVGARGDLATLRTGRELTALGRRGLARRELGTHGGAAGVETRA